MGIEVPDEHNPGDTISLTYEEFLDAIARMHEVNFPIERDPAEAWQEFVGWRVNYERSAYAVAAAIEAVPALWSGPRHQRIEAISPSAHHWDGRPPSSATRPLGTGRSAPAARRPDIARARIAATLARFRSG